MEFNSSRLVVPSVQELAKDPNMVSIPSRYIQHHQNSQSNNVITNSVSLDDQIPVINFQNLFLADDDNPSELSNLHSACKDWGFFQLVNHGISDSLIEKVKKGIEELFNLPVEEKKKLCQLPGDIEGFGQSFVFTEEQKLDWNDYLLIFTLPLALRKPHLFPNLPTTLKENSMIGPAKSLINEKNPALYRTLPNKEYFKGLFSRELDGKNYIDSMKL
ncbi:hypothetical protein F8388_025731 [Cannabis sativa]|uniref:Non-haem dioxygenase N-terminal domain-containing protein n=1 Tax=Cannabis sativa TaxID=3483 RepID=A0A7J6F9B1_CANSA|nr:hypothetical protein G4B88_023166 [Cannabis sativa]KAF4367313.1 hypothetical protein F8388_025731 [Cannabis sativa]